MNGVIISWCCKKQPETALYSTGAEICALHAGVMKTKILHLFSASIGFPMTAATPTMEDNQGMIKCIKSSCITDNVHHLDVQITWLAEQYDTGDVKLTYRKTEVMLADCATKLVSGSSLRKQVSYMIGQRYYPLPSTRDYHDIELSKYPWMPDSLNIKTSSPFVSMNSQMRGGCWNMSHAYV